MSKRDLYFISGSPPCWTIMLALEVKGLAYEQRRLNNTKGEQKAPAFLNVNPRGHVPVLTESDFTVCETLAILAYLDAAHPEPPLFGKEPGDTARIWQAICDCDGNLREPVGDISRPLFRGKVQEAAEKIVDTAAIVRDELALLETRVSVLPWMVGDAMSAADLVLYPVLMQLLRAVSMDDAEPLNLAIHPFSVHFPKLAMWCQKMESIPGFKNAYPPHWK